MYSKALDPDIMRTMLPPDFPADKLSQPQYKMVVEKDVMIPMRDGVMIAANIYRPDAPGTFPALHAADSYQKDMVDLVPTLPIFHCVEVNDIEYFVSRGYVFVHTRLARHRPLARRRVGLLEPGGTDRPLRHDRVDRGAGLVHRQGRHARRVAAGVGAVVRRLPAAASPDLHPAVGRRRRHVPRRGLARRHDGRRVPHRLAHVGDPRALPARPAGTLRHRACEPRLGALGPRVERHQPSDVRRLLEAPEPRLLEDRGARSSPSVRCTRWACTCAASCAATKRCGRRRR